MSGEKRDIRSWGQFDQQAALSLADGLTRGSHSRKTYASVLRRGVHEMRSIGKLERVDLREVWRHEATEFTTWLEENIEFISEVVDLELTVNEREAKAGDFSVDLLAETATGETVVIENQLERSNHDHLGKLLTYLTAFDAKSAIWIVSDARAEHVAAVNWLNESSAADFYLLKLEAVRIDSSSPAPLLTKIVGPSDEARAAGTAKKEMTERGRLRHSFWTQLLELAKKRTPLHANVSPGTASWLGASAGRSGLAYNYVVRQRDTRVELYIDRGKDSEDYNLACFEGVLARRAEIEEAFGGELEWQQLPGKRACRVLYKLRTGGWRDEKLWPSVMPELIDAMVRFEAALREHLRDLGSISGD